MKKLILLTMLLGLTGCGDNNQSDTTQNNAQSTTLQKAEASPAVANYSLAASPRAMSAVAPLAGWNVTKSTVMGASTLIDAIKDTKVSAAQVTPNAKQVAEVLRGGAAGIALTIAVDQLLGAVDWVMDPANNQIRYKPKPKVGEPPEGKYLWHVSTQDSEQTYAYSATESCTKWASIIGKYYSNEPAHFVRVENVVEIRDTTRAHGYCITYPEGFRQEHTVYMVGELVDINAPKEKTLSLETVAEQVISNADADSLDAQVATNIAAQNILNDSELAKPVVQELENNANDRCAKHNIKMDSQAALVEWRYEELYFDRLKLYRNHYDVSNPYIDENGVKRGSWLGHISQYKFAQGKLRSFINAANNDGCPATPKAKEWVDKAPPPEPGVHS
ncbi:hypothetical protein MMP66_05670 [Acinetobacter dispersus]|uniref:hypothetical protein n=1 Tax=Acinetobacter dispersus TaxID=70348 RepID=UPI001F4B26E8|nr:hypothetical protein [Acinetobacter dispersus]MCH7393768.1 hypothetical protein [Acinetobacter dispersus]